MIHLCGVCSWESGTSNLEIRRTSMHARYKVKMIKFVS